MQFDPRFARDFPHVTVFLRKALPMTPYYTDIWPAFLRYAQLGEAEARAALEEGSEPLIMSWDMGERYGDYLGDFNAKLRNVIFLNRRYLLYYEMSSLNRQDVLFQRFLHAVTLHEMVHWGDNRDGSDQPGEEGNAFEHAVWGERIGDYEVWKRRADDAFHLRFPRALR